MRNGLVVGGGVGGCVDVVFFWFVLFCFWGLVWLGANREGGFGVASYGENRRSGVVGGAWGAGGVGQELQENRSKLNTASGLGGASGRPGEKNRMRVSSREQKAREVRGGRLRTGFDKACKTTEEPVSTGGSSVEVLK